MNFLMKDWLLHQSSQEEASSSIAASIMTSLERRRQQQSEIIFERSKVLLPVSSSKGRTLLPKHRQARGDNNVSNIHRHNHHKRKDSDSDLVGLKFLKTAVATENINNKEEDNWDQLSIDDELCILILDEEDEEGYSHDDLNRISTPIHSPSSVMMTNRLHQLSKKL